MLFISQGQLFHYMFAIKPFFPRNHFSLIATDWIQGEFWFPTACLATLVLTRKAIVMLLPGV